jgi:CRP-like cAMP-binding protein
VGGDVFDDLTEVVPSAIASGGVRSRPVAAGPREDRPLRRSDIEMLGGVPLFAGLSRRHLRRLAEHADVITFREGEFVVREGQLGGTFYVIVEGEAKVLRRDRTVATIGPSGFFGEISLLDGGPRTADVIATTPVRAIRIFKKAFDRMVAEEPGVAAKILEVVARRLRDTETRSLRT